MLQHGAVRPEIKVPPSRRCFRTASPSVTPTYAPLEFLVIALLHGGVEDEGHPKRVQLVDRHRLHRSRHLPPQPRAQRLLLVFSRIPVYPRALACSRYGVSFCGSVNFCRGAFGSEGIRAQG